MVRIVATLVLLGHLQKVIEGKFQCEGTCYRGNLSPNSEKIIPNKHMVGFSYKNITTYDQTKCYAKCIQDCRCNACQMKDGVCELLDYDRTFKPDFFHSEPGYVYMDLDQHSYQGKSHIVPPGVSCYNGCCRSQPCMNGGTCVEHCHTPLEKFTCECPNRYTGRVCEKLITECFDVRKYASPSYVVRGKEFILTRSDNGQEIAVYCSIFIRGTRTLVESFSLANNNHLKNSAFFEDVPKSPTDPNWALYRLSLDMMTYLRSKTTFFVATCSFNRKFDPNIPDFLMAAFSEFDPMKPVDSSAHCFKAVMLNIRGHKFKNQQTPIWQWKGISHPHIDVSKGSCGLPVINGTVQSEDLFGAYDLSSINPASTCTNDQKATTNWWFGNSYDLM